MAPAVRMKRYGPLAEVNTWPRTVPDIDPGTIDQRQLARTADCGHPVLGFSATPADDRMVDGISPFASLA